MKVISGTVVGGKIDVPIDAFAEGASGAILAADRLNLPAHAGAGDELVAAVEDIRRGSMSMAKTGRRPEETH
jgi:hypothetical protein